MMRIFRSWIAYIIQCCYICISMIHMTSQIRSSKCVRYSAIWQDCGMSNAFRRLLNKVRLECNGIIFQRPFSNINLFLLTTVVFIFEFPNGPSQNNSDWVRNRTAPNHYLNQWRFNLLRHISVNRLRWVHSQSSTITRAISLDISWNGLWVIHIWVEMYSK